MNNNNYININNILSHGQILTFPAACYSENGRKFSKNCWVFFFFFPEVKYVSQLQIMYLKHIWRFPSSSIKSALLLDLYNLICWWKTTLGPNLKELELYSGKWALTLIISIIHLSLGFITWAKIPSYHLNASLHSTDI